MSLTKVIISIVDFQKLIIRNKITQVSTTMSTTIDNKIRKQITLLENQKLFFEMFPELPTVTTTATGATLDIDDIREDIMIHENKRYLININTEIQSSERPYLIKDEEMEKYLDHMTGFTWDLSSYYGNIYVNINDERATVNKTTLLTYLEHTSNSRWMFYVGLARFSYCSRRQIIDEVRNFQNEFPTISWHTEYRFSKTTRSDILKQCPTDEIL